MNFEGWTLEQALVFVRELEEVLSPLGFHCGLTGSILYKGQSDNDLDVTIFPHKTMQMDASMLPSAFEWLGLTRLADRVQVTRLWQRKDPLGLDTKHVEAWKTADGRKVDFFFLR